MNKFRAPSLVVRSAGDGKYEWVRPRSDGATTVVESGDPDALARAAAGNPLLVLLSGAAMRLTAATIPARSSRQAALAAPFAVEDDIAEEIEAMYVVCSQDLGHGQRIVAYARRVVIDELVEPLVVAGCQVVGVQPDFLALPFQPDHWSLVVNGARVLVRTGRYQGFAIEADSVDTVVHKLRREISPIGLHRFGGCPPYPSLIGIPIQAHPCDENPLTLLAANVDFKSDLNLLPAKWRVRHGAHLRSLWAAAAILILALIAHAGFMWRANSTLQSSLKDIREAQTIVMRQAFPELTRVVNPLVQAEQAVAELRARARRPAASMLDILHVAGRALPRKTSNTPTLAGINYADGVLNLRLRAADIAELNSYSESLTPFVRAEVISVDSRDDGVDGNLRIQPLLGALP